MPSQEEIKVRMGLDATALQTGTNAVLDQQKKAAMDYVSWWNKAITEKEDQQTRTEIEGATRRNRARQLLRERELEQEKRHARDMAEVGNGYVPQTWQQQAALNKKYGKYGYGKGAGAEMAGNMAGMEIASGLEHGESPRELGRELGDIGISMAGGSAGEMATRYLLRKFGRLVAKGLASGAAKVLGEVGAGYTGWEIGEWINDRYINKPTEENQKATAETREKIAKLLEKEIDAAVSAGHISREAGEGLKGNLGSYSGIRRAQTAVAPFAMADANAQLRETERKKEFEAMRESLTGKNRLNLDYRERYRIAEQMQHLEMNSKAWLEKKIELDTQDKRIAEDKLEIQRKQKEFDERAKEILKERHNIEHEWNSIDVERPTIETLAGHGFTSALSKLYGQGGKYDLGAGDGPFANIAQMALLKKNQEMWDIIHGNAKWQIDATGKSVLVGGQAYQDKLQRMSYENMLSGAGLETPQMQMSEMNKNLTQIDEKMAALIEAAKGEGIVIKTTN
jgi:hypothetical protein